MSSAESSSLVPFRADDPYAFDETRLAERIPGDSSTVRIDAQTLATLLAGIDNGRS